MYFTMGYRTTLQFVAPTNDESELRTTEQRPPRRRQIFVTDSLAIVPSLCQLIFRAVAGRWTDGEKSWMVLAT